MLNEYSNKEIIGLFIFGLCSAIIGWLLHKYMQNINIRSNELYSSEVKSKKLRSLYENVKSKSTINGGIKMMLIVRTDIGMTKGKIGAQCGHAALGLYQEILKNKSPIGEVWRKVCRKWEWNGSKKVCVKVSSEEQMDKLHKKARKEHLPCYLVMDAGLTQLETGSKTVLAIGPDHADSINPLTEDLKLL